jgi:hypothetical protein
MTAGDTAWAEVEAQGVLKPGEPGWWKVWGATPRHIQPGDLVLSIEGETFTLNLIEDTYLAKNSPLRVGVVIEGTRMTFGALTEIILLRKGTHNFLA